MPFECIHRSFVYLVYTVLAKVFSLCVLLAPIKLQSCQNWVHYINITNSSNVVISNGTL
ncbi:hypothetical protein DESC_850022 [Desulfosarcina cetonica]|nr:hypothetical protein DESC_850022 [Desulfosarcina cetonica]